MSSSPPPLSLIAAVAFAFACAGSDTDRSVPGTTSRAQFTIVATDYAFESPDTIAEGWTTFRLINRGRQPHMAQLIRLEPGTTVDEYLTAYGAAFRAAGPRPAGGRRLGGPGVAAPQATTNATLFLEPGQYVWICLFNVPDGVPHVVGHGMADPFVVKASGADPTRGAPEADVVVRLTDYAFDLSAPLRAGRHVIRAQNSGAESHEVGVAKLHAGKTIEDFRAWIRNPTESPPVDMQGVGGVTSLAPGTEAYFDIDLAPGEYALFCLVTAGDGRSHVDHGMIRQIRIG